MQCITLPGLTYSVDWYCFGDYGNKYLVARLELVIQVILNTLECLGDAIYLSDLILPRTSSSSARFEDHDNLFSEKGFTT